MSIPPQKAAKESTRNAEQDARRCWTTCMHFVAVLRGKDRQKAKGEVGCFPQGLWPCRLSLAVGAVSGHSDQADEEGASNQQFHQVGFWLCVQIIKHELQKDNNVRNYQA